MISLINKRGNFMKNLIMPALCALFVTTSLPVSSAITVNPPPKSAITELKYENAEKNYSIEHPAEWTKKDMPKLDLVLFSPAKGAAKEPEASMNVVSEKIESSVNLDQFYTESINNLTKTLKDVKIKKNGDTSLNGVASKWVVYTHALQGNTFEVLQYFIVAQDMIYLITFSSKEANFEHFRPVFEKAASSFKLLNEHKLITE